MSEEVVTRKWKLADIGTFIKNSFLAILQGRFLLRLKIDKVFIHIVYTFFLMAMFILVSLAIENSLNRVEENKKTVRALEIVCADKTFEVANKSRASAVKETLTKLGSRVGEPKQNATVLTK